MSDKLFKDFNFSLLDDPRFKEESVREELLAPLIKDLGYTNSGNTQVIRNHGLKHPFVSIGSSRKNITVIPDYLMQVSEKPAWILEAKSPFEQITDTKHIEQAYSYAIHPEIRVNYFALCNGHYFILYNISRSKPLFHISLRGIDLYRNMLKELISPIKVFSYPDLSLSKDLGLHFKRLGFTHSDTTLIIGIKPLTIMKYHDDLFSISAPVGDKVTAYLGTFDFNLEVAKQLRPILGEKDFIQIMQPAEGRQIRFNLDSEISLNIKICLPQKEDLIENDKEIYLPLTIKEFVT
ncbi:MAG: restriction endonuclease [Bacteroidota bacterium]